jgi:hypothetical protein
MTFNYETEYSWGSLIVKLVPMFPFHGNELLINPMTVTMSLLANYSIK